MRILFVVHGYPPRETAGTERHVEALAQHAQALGHDVMVVAATRSPGHRPYETWVESVQGVPVHRVVNNVPARPLHQMESDPSIDRVLEAIAGAFEPDVVHIHHLQFLSSTVQWPCPTVITLHDQWMWCAAGGLGLRPDGTHCPAPDPHTCATCAQAWRPSAGRLTRVLGTVAGAVGPWVSPARLHRLWTAIPARVRPRPERGKGPAGSPSAATARQAAMRRVLEAAHTVLSPSRWLADRCATLTGVHPHVVPHGLHSDWTGPRAPQARSGVLFLGTIAAHKGPQHVVAAWRQACPSGAPPLRLHGTVQDASLALGHPISPVLDSEGVRQALDQAQVLVVGSTWPENAPLVLLEARARGCPVVATHVGGVPELIGPSDGVLVPPGDVPAMAVAMRTVLDQPAWSPRPPPTLDAQARRTLALLAHAAESPCPPSA